MTHTKLREEFRRGNSGKHERTGRYSSNILYQAPTVESRARSVVADRRQKEHEELMISYYAAKSNEKTDPRVADTSLDDDDSEADEAFARMMLNADLHSDDDDDDDSVAGMEGDEEEEDEEEEEEQEVSDSDEEVDEALLEDDEYDTESMDEDEDDGDIDCMFPNRDEMLQFLMDQHRIKWSNYSNNVCKDIPPYNEKNENPQQPTDALPVHLVAATSLLKILSMHTGSGLKLFNNLMKWVIHFSAKSPNVWNDAAITGMITRDAVMKELSRIFDADHLRPTPVEVTLSGEKRVDVQVFDFQKQLVDLLTNHSLMDEDNLHREHFDKSTWKPTKSYATMNDNDIVGDVHTGTMYQKGIDEYCSGTVPEGIDRILPLPIILSSDESNQDSNFGNTTTPMTWRPGIIRSEERCKISSCRTLCLLPNTKIGTGKNRNQHDEEWLDNGKKRGQKNLTPKKVARDKVEDMQTLYRAGLSSLLDFIKTKGGVPLMWQGKRCFVKVFVLFLVGDAKEYNLITNHYNCPGNLGLHCITPRCFCSPEELQQAPRNNSCRSFTRADIWKCQENEDYAHRCSQYPQPSAFDELPLANIEEMISGSLPPETLHVNCLGNFKDVLVSIKRIIGKKDTNKATKDRFDMLFHHVSNCMTRSACKDMLRPANRGGPMDLSRTTGKEVNANVHVGLVTMHTREGTKFLRPLFKKKNLNYSEALEAMEGLLAYNEWINSSDITKSDLDNADNAVFQLMEDLCEHLPLSFANDDGEGGNDRMKLKFHCLYNLLRDVQKFGSARNFNGEHTEHDHQTIVKRNGDGTQKRNKTFTAQTARQEGLRQILMIAHRLVEHLCPTFDHHTYDMASSDRRRQYDPKVRDDNFTVAGQYTILAGNANSRHQMTINHTWLRREKNVLQVPLNSDLLFQLTDHAIKNKWNRGLTIEGYTELTVTSDGGNTTYRATEDYSGEPWYDWVFIRDPTERRVTYPAKIVGFFKYLTPGYPTFVKTKMERRTPQDLLTSTEKGQHNLCCTEGSEGRHIT